MHPASGLVRASVLAAVFLAIAYCFSRTDLLALAAPFAVAALLGVVHLRAGAPTVEVSSDTAEIAEGETLAPRIVVTAQGDLDAMEIFFESRDFRSVNGDTAHWITTLDACPSTTFELPCVAPLFGFY